MYFPEGKLINTNANQYAMRSKEALYEAFNKSTVLEERAILCDNEHNLHVDLGGIMKGIIPKNEGAMGLDDGTVRDIAVISKVNKPVMFIITGFETDETDQTYAVLSRKAVQERCKKEYIDKLSCGDIIPVKVCHMESFGVFVDIGAGINALLPIDSISVSRIPHPNVRFFTGQEIKAIVKTRDEQGRIILSHKELLGTWEENAKEFSVGETVPGIIRSVEKYGIFVELSPNLAGLAEYSDNIVAGQCASVYIKNIIPERMKLKLIIVDCFNETIPPEKIKYYYEGDHISTWKYSPDLCEKIIESDFG